MKIPIRLVGGNNNQRTIMNMFVPRKYNVDIVSIMQFFNWYGVMVR